MRRKSLPQTRCYPFPFSPPPHPPSLSPFSPPTPPSPFSGTSALFYSLLLSLFHPLCIVPFRFLSPSLFTFSSISSPYTSNVSFLHSLLPIGFILLIPLSLFLFFPSHQLLPSLFSVPCFILLPFLSHCFSSRHLLHPPLFLPIFLRLRNKLDKFIPREDRWC